MRSLKTLLFASILVTLFLTSSYTNAKIITGEGTALPHVEYFNIGGVEFKWKHATSNGQIYLTWPDKFLEIANISEAPDNFLANSKIISFKGPIDLFKNKGNNYSFSKVSPHTSGFVAGIRHGKYNGIFIFKNRKICAAVDFIKRKKTNELNNLLEYKYWINTEGRCIFDNEYNLFVKTKDGKVDTTAGNWTIFDKDQTINEKINIENLLVKNRAQIVFNKRVIVTGKVYISDGETSFKSSAKFNDLIIDQSSTVNFKSDKTFTINGHLINKGEINFNESEILITGEEYQIISPNNASFYNLSVIKKTNRGRESYVNFDGPLIVSNYFSVNFGNVFIDDQSTFYDVIFEHSGGLYPSKEATIYFQGNVKIGWKFKHNYSTLIFNGDDFQEITFKSSYKFYNLVFKNDDIEFVNPYTLFIYGEIEGDIGNLKYIKK